MWLSILTTRKLDPQWEGGWTIQDIVSPINAKILDGQRTRVLHVNCLHHSRVIPQQVDPSCAPTKSINRWHPPQIYHVIVSADPPVTEPIEHYPQQERRPPDRYVP